MRYCSILLATLIAQASAFSSPKATISITSSHFASTLEAPTEEKTTTADPGLGEDPVTTSMDVEKAWPVDEFVKDSDRVLP